MYSILFLDLTQQNIMLDVICQIVISITGVTALFLMAKGNRWGFVVGLISQPFWFITTYQHQQWGIFGISFVYTANWIYGIYNWFFNKNFIRK